MKLPEVLSELLSNLRRKPVTIEYGWKTGPTPTRWFRGLHHVDAAKCISCSLCSLECPSNAIEMRTYPEIRDHRGRPRRFPVIHYSRCIFCYHCVDICPRHAYITTPEPPPATGDVESLQGLPENLPEPVQEGGQHGGRGSAEQGAAAPRGR